MSYRKYIKLDGTELTDQGRSIIESRDERSVMVELANGTHKRYYKKLAKRWEITWTWIPNDTSTVDARGGRDAIRAVAQAESSKTFIITDVAGADASYTVFVVDYSETLLRRDYENNRSFWEIQLSLEEA